MTSNTECFLTGPDLIHVTLTLLRLVKEHVVAVPGESKCDVGPVFFMSCLRVHLNPCFSLLHMFPAVSVVVDSALGLINLVYRHGPLALAFKDLFSASLMLEV